jgi:predicted dehydrogenase
VATFTIPRLPSSNFRTDPMRGGGALADMGVYAMSPARVFGNGDLLEITAHVTQWIKNCDIGFSVSAKYSDGLRMNGKFSLAADYKNQLTLEGEGFYSRLAPAFSFPPDGTTRVELIIDGVDQGFSVRHSDAFARFLSNVVTSLEKGDRSIISAQTARSTADFLTLLGATL